METNKNSWKSGRRLLILYLAAFVFLAYGLMLFDNTMKGMFVLKPDPRDKPLAACIKTFMACSPDEINVRICQADLIQCIGKMTTEYKEKYGGS
jgi:hypothetical protein